MDRLITKEFCQTQALKSAGEAVAAVNNKGLMNRNAMLIVGVLVALLAALYHEVILRMGIQWNDDPDYSHGFLVPVLVGYFLWERWDRLKASRLMPSLWGVGLL